MPRDLYQPGSAYHVARRKYAAAAVQCLQSAMHLLGQPHSLLDVGCGQEAPLVHWSRTAGVDAWGVDLATPDDPASRIFAWDLQRPLSLYRHFEWVLCWEVAEHLPADVAETLCDTVVRHLVRPGGRLLFTAAPPGQRGPGHIHCQPATYWRHLLAERGLVWLERESSKLALTWRHVAPSARWYAANLQVLTWA